MPCCSYSLPWTYPLAWYRLVNVNFNVVFHTGNTIISYQMLCWPTSLTPNVRFYRLKKECARFWWRFSFFYFLCLCKNMLRSVDLRQYLEVTYFALCRIHGGRGAHYIFTRQKEVGVNFYVRRTEKQLEHIQSAVSMYCLAFRLGRSSLSAPCPVSMKNTEPNVRLFGHNGVIRTKLENDAIFGLANSWLLNLHYSHAAYSNGMRFPHVFAGEFVFPNWSSLARKCLLRT